MREPKEYATEAEAIAGTIADAEKHGAVLLPEKHNGRPLLARFVPVLLSNRITTDALAKNCAFCVHDPDTCEALEPLREMVERAGGRPPDKWHDCDCDGCTIEPHASGAYVPDVGRWDLFTVSARFVATRELENEAGAVEHAGHWHGRTSYGDAMNAKRPAVFPPGVQCAGFRFNREHPPKAGEGQEQLFTD